jgi:hypothetical protein
MSLMSRVGMGHSTATTRCISAVTDDNRPGGKENAPRGRPQQQDKRNQNKRRNKIKAEIIICRVGGRN